MIWRLPKTSGTKWWSVRRSLKNYDKTIVEHWEDSKYTKERPIGDKTFGYWWSPGDCQRPLEPTDDPLEDYGRMISRH